MLRINEKSIKTIDDTRMNFQLKKFSRGYYLVNRQLIEFDIDRLDALYNEVTDKKVREEIQDGIVYLLDLLDSLSESNYLQTIWCTIDGKIISKPFQFRDFKHIGIYSYRYLEKYEDYTIQINLSDIKNALAIQMCHRDMCYDTQYLDKALTEMGIGIKGIDKAERLFDVTLDNAYDECIQLLAGDNAYMSYDEENQVYVYRDYFGGIVKSNTYKEILESSLSKATTLVIMDILNKLRGIAEYDTYFIGAMGDSVYFASNMDNATLNDVFLDTISLRVLGRSFDVTPTIKKVQ